MKKNLVALIQRMREIDDRADSRSGVVELSDYPRFSGIERVRQLRKQLAEQQEKDAHAVLHQWSKY